MEFSSTFRKPPGFLSNENRKLPIVVLGNPHCFLVSKYTTRKPPENLQETPRFLYQLKVEITNSTLRNPQGTSIIF